MTNQPTPLAFDLDESFPHLPGAPVVEAVVQWRARAEVQLNPDSLRALLGERLPEYPKLRSGRKLGLELKWSADGSTEETRHNTWGGIRVADEDERNVALFTRDGLTVSRLAPYQNWDAFESEARRLWRLYLEVARPSEVQQIGVRFVNRIPLGDLDEVDQYLVRPPVSPPGLDLPVGGFLHQDSYAVPGRPYQLNVVQTVQPSPGFSHGQAGLILDIEVLATESLPVDDDASGPMLAEMRWLKNKVFFSCLRKEAIDGFQQARETTP